MTTYYKWYIPFYYGVFFRCYFPISKCFVHKSGKAIIEKCLRIDTTISKVTADEIIELLDNIYLKGTKKLVTTTDSII